MAKVYRSVCVCVSLTQRSRFRYDWLKHFLFFNIPIYYTIFIIESIFEPFFILDSYIFFSFCCFFSCSCRILFLCCFRFMRLIFVLFYIDTNSLTLLLFAACATVGDVIRCCVFSANPDIHPYIWLYIHGCFMAGWVSGGCVRCGHTDNAIAPHKTCWCYTVHSWPTCIIFFLSICVASACCFRIYIFFVHAFFVVSLSAVATSFSFHHILLGKRSLAKLQECTQEATAFIAYRIPCMLWILFFFSYENCTTFY